MTEQTLHDVLARATDEIESPNLVATALTAAHRRRTHRRVVLAAVGSTIAVASVIAAVTLVDANETPEPAPGPTQPTPTLGETPSAIRGAEATQPVWDPFTIVEEPFRATVLPEVLDPPANPPSVADQLMAAAVVAWPEEGHDLRLLGTDGVWRSVPGTAEAVTGTLDDVVRPALSSDGSQVAMSANDGILVVDVTTGEQTLIPWPDPIDEPWDVAPGLLWLPNDEGFAVLHWKATWLVTLDGEGRKAPFGGPYGSGLSVDPDGLVVERRWQPEDLTAWRGDQVVSRVNQFWYWGERHVTRHGRLAFTGAPKFGQGASDGPMVFDVQTGELLAYAPIRDPNSVYSDNGYLTAQGFLDENTVLVLVGPMDFRTMDLGDETWHLVAWRIDTGAFERLTRGDTRMRGIDVAADVLAADWDG